MIYQEGNYYHLYNRGCNKEKIFQETEDYELILKIILDSNFTDYIELCSFSLMPNHYHFLVKQISSKPVTNWIRYIFNRYVRTYNKKNHRTGTLFESRVKAKLITDTHYIHNNPRTNYQLQFCSISYLRTKELISNDFYNQYFNGIEQYLILFEEYKLVSKEKEVEEYLNLYR